MALDKFDAAEAEARISAQWMQAGAFRAGANASRPETFTIMIPPPNVTGALHVGHAFNNTLQDILVRWHRMRGYDTLWQPGQDHAGIATQLQVEKLLKSSGQPGRRELGRAAFLGKVWEWKAQYGDTIIRQLQRLGCSCDWDRNAFTMSGAPGAPVADSHGNFHDAVIRVFVDMYHKGLIYRGKRLVNWDPHFETAISDLEVENIEVDGHMWHFKYPLAGGATYRYVAKDAEGIVIVDEIRDYISIATTRPETMLGDGAVAVHPSDERYAPIVGKLCEIPVGPREHRRLIPIITDDYPDPAFGSGAVKITGAHDANDYGVAKRGGIPLYRLMDTRGHMRDDGAPYAEASARAQQIAEGAAFTEAEVDGINLVPDHLRGLDRFEARKAVVAEVTAERLAMMTTADDPRLGRRVGSSPTLPEAEAPALVPLVEAKKIMQPFGDRSGVVIEPMLTDQWFVDAEKVVGPALEAVRSGQVRILPESGEKTYYHWLENIEPWCISRQLWWGHQIPVWYIPRYKSGDGITQTYDETPDFTDPVAFCAPNWEAAQVQIRDYALAQGINLGFLDGPHDSAAAAAAEFARDPYGLVVWRDPDVLDTWFSSGLWPIGTLGWPEDTEEMRKYFPTDVLITGADILFFWVARMMMMQLAVVNDIPFHTVYLHQLVRDEKGQKMSKTKGNVIDPLEIVDEFGADALRFTMAQMAAIGGVLKLSRERIKGYRNFGTKLWSAASYGELRGCFDVPHADTAPATTLVLNNWIKGEVARTRASVDHALAEYRFNDAANTLYAFVWNVFCDWYLEFTKPIFDTGTEAEVAETRATYAWVLDQCMILLHPIMPFITEELWSKKARPKMLVHADWPLYSAADLADPEADREMGWVIGLIDAVRSVRAQMHVPAGAKVPLVVAGFEAAARAAYARNEAMILRLARIDSLTEVEAFEKGTATIPLPGATFGLPLAGVIDIAEEKARLEKTLEKLGKELGGLRGRLNNPAFVASAPEEVVIETREALAAREDEDAKLRAALARLAELD